MEFHLSIGLALLGAFAWMTTGAVIQHLKKDMGLVDFFWAAGIGLAAIFFFSNGSGNTERRLIAMTLAAFWSIRLSSHLFKNRIWNKKEDQRYANLRTRWKNKAPLYFVFIFEAQALLIVFFAIPFSIVASNSKPLAWLDIIAIIFGASCIWAEGVADQQLEKFKKSEGSQGKTCRDGLWRYSRHPNYFFEWLYWFSYVLLAWNTENALWTLLAPCAMFVFLFRITGIPHTEKQALKSRGADYKEYQKTTSVFIPWFPKK